ncbi:hypothetical protein JXB12_06805 [candidate division KSB1 bacterium]|nr:hypothetical protein [candidate division KSB1 bacterium]
MKTRSKNIVKKRKTTIRARTSSGSSILKSLNEVNNKAANRGSFIIILLIIIIIAGLMIGSIWQKVRFSQMAAEIELLQQQEHELVASIESKRVEVFNLKNDNRIVNIATDHLNMISNPPFEVLSPGESEINKYADMVSQLKDEIQHKQR